MCVCELRVAHDLRVTVVIVVIIIVVRVRIGVRVTTRWWGVIPAVSVSLRRQCCLVARRMCECAACLCPHRICRPVGRHRRTCGTSAAGKRGKRAELAVFCAAAGAARGANGAGRAMATACFLIIFSLYLYLICIYDFIIFFKTKPSPSSRRVKDSSYSTLSAGRGTPVRQARSKLPPKKIVGTRRDNSARDSHPAVALRLPAAL